MQPGAFVTMALAVLSRSSEGHSWVACTDYRGDVNYFEQEKCYAWPRNYRPQPVAKGYQIASPESQAFSGSFDQACHVKMSSPSWKSGYSDAFPHAVYEPGKVYCLAWPMKNHGWLPDSCSNPHSKSDAGLDDTLHLYVSSVNPQADPSQAEFNMKNVNELAGLASNCNPDNVGNRAEFDECQLGLEKHQNYERDCKGFLRSPKFCESSGMAMGTGCFKVPADMEPGHYVAQWHWQSSFFRDAGLQTIPYMSCFDFEVVANGSSAARSGKTGTTGTPESDLPCENNVLKFGAAAPSPAPTPVPVPATMPAPTPTPAPTPASSCAEEAEAGEECAHPGWSSKKCCPAGLECVYWQDSGYARCQGPSSTPTCAGEAAAGEYCAQPGWNSVKCCPTNLECVHWQDSGYARCQQPNSALTQKASTLASSKRRKFLGQGTVLMQLGHSAVSEEL